MKLRHVFSLLASSLLVLSVHAQVVPNATNAQNLTGSGFIYLNGDNLFTPPVSITGSSFLWWPTKGALSIGNMASLNTTTDIGSGSYAFGNSARASGANSIAFGRAASATTTSSIAIGSATTANGDGSTAIGKLTTASGGFSLALGTYAQATGSNAIAIGVSSTASGGNGIAIGDSASATAAEATAIGSLSKATGWLSFAATTGVASGDGAIAFGGGYADAYASTAFYGGTAAQYGIVFGWNTNLKKDGTSVPNATTPSAEDPVFEIGNIYNVPNGANNNALTIFRDGTVRVGDRFQHGTLEVTGTTNLADNTEIGTADHPANLKVAGTIEAASGTIGGSSILTTTNFASHALSRLGGSVEGTLSVAGNVGIGTSSPRAALDVAGQLRATEALIDGSPVVTAANVTNYSLPLTGGNLTGTLGVSGNVGIGTFDPTAKLQVVGGVALSGPFVLLDSKVTSISDPTGTKYNTIAVRTQTIGALSATQRPKIYTSQSALVTEAEFSGEGIMYNQRGALTGVANYSGSSGMSGLYGMLLQPAVTSTGTVGSAFGMQVQPVLTSTGSIQNCYYYSAVRARLQSTGDITGGLIAGFCADDIGRPNAAGVSGVYIQDLAGCTGVTSGYRSLVSDGTRKFNVYIDGTAPNYFAGNVGIGTSTSTERLEVVGNVKVSGTITGDLRMTAPKGGISMGSFQ